MDSIGHTLKEVHNNNYGPFGVEKTGVVLAQSPKSHAGANVIKNVRKSREALTHKNYGNSNIGELDIVKIGQIPEKILIEASKVTHDRAVEAWKNAEK